MKIRFFFILLMLAICMLVSACKTASTNHIVSKKGKASYYSNKLAGKKTASGEVYRPTKLTAAHKSLPLGTQLKVTNLDNKKTVIVCVNDRGPYTRGRIIDLSKGAARKLGMLKAGVAKVRIEYKKVQ